MKEATQYVTSREDYKKAGESEIKFKRYDSLINPKGTIKRVKMDKKMYKLLKQFAKDPEIVDEVVEYLESQNYGCRRVPEHLEAAIEAFQGNHAPSFAWNKFFRMALKDASHHFNPKGDVLKPEKSNTLDQISELFPRKDTHAGYSYWLFDKKSKGEYLEEWFVEYLHELQEEAILHGTFNLPILIGTRLQQSGAFDDEGNETPESIKFKERMVNMIDIILIASEAKFSKPVQKLFGESRSYAGGKDPVDLEQIIYNMRSKYNSWISLDYSKYDQSIPGWLIQACFDIIKDWFKLNEDEEKLFDVIVHDFINKSIVWRDGELVYVHDGVPSGSMFTQIIDTLANYIMIRTYSYAKSQITEGIDFECNICGDDNLIFHNGNIVKEELCSYIKHNFGIEAHPNKCSEGSRKDDPEYLSRTWRTLGIYRQPKQLVAKLLYAERYRDYKKNKDLDPVLIFYSYYLCYNLGMREFFDMDKFFAIFGYKLVDIPASRMESTSGFFNYQLRYNPKFRSRLRHLNVA